MNRNKNIRSAVGKPLRDWEQLAEPHPVTTLLYEGQISAALKVDSIPLRLVWTQDMWDQLKHCLNNGIQIGPPDYPGCQADVSVAASRWIAGGETALVVGSVSPWLEAILLRAGCKRMITLDIGKIQCEVDELQTITYSEWRESSMHVDIIASFSTVEHFGLGRYGDKHSRNADIQWMREFAYPNLKPKGIQFLSVPVADSYYQDDAHRIYGPQRMQQLTNGWRLVEVIFQGQVLDHIPYSEEFSGEDWQKQPLLVLKREAT